MKIYDTRTAPNPRRVRIFLSEKGIEVPYQPVDIVRADNRSAAFLAKNPLGTVPVLELDDGTCIAESVAICRYFEEVQPDPPLMGIDARDRAVVEMWQRRMELELFLPILHVFRNSHASFRDRVSQVPAWSDVCRGVVERTLGWLNEVLAGRSFVAGDGYTIADITALCGIDFARVSNIRLRPEHTHVARWHEAVSARQSAKA